MYICNIIISLILHVYMLHQENSKPLLYDTIDTE